MKETTARPPPHENTTPANLDEMKNPHEGGNSKTTTTRKHNTSEPLIWSSRVVVLMNFHTILFSNEA